MLFNTLSKKLAIPLISLSDSIKSQEESQSATDNGIVLTGSDYKGILSRLDFMLFRKSAVKKKVKELEEYGVCVSSILSVFPDVDNPLIVFNQSSQAENYCKDNILPKMDVSFKGIIKRILCLLGGNHPSVNSFILLTGNTDKFKKINSILNESKLHAQQDLLCITTSNPVFLSFSANAVPDYVVHHAELGDFELRQELHRVLEPIISKPLTQTIHEKQSYFVESGLPGKPWFQLLKNNKLSMNEIKVRSLNTLKDFEQRIKKVEHWTKSIDAVEIFNQQFEQSHAIRKFKPSIVSACSELVGSLPQEYVVKGSWQHGDYCINNLIFADDKTYVIDFEEFGDTLMPLQDIFSLALSFYIQREIQTLDLLALDLAYCLRATDKNLKPLLSLLFIYHLLFRLGAWGSNPNRAFICDWLQDILVKHIENPRVLFLEFLTD